MRIEPEHSLSTSKAAFIRSMFAQIAPKYDFLNHALSFNVDRRWRRVLVDKLSCHLRRPGAVALDLCCGTADLSLELATRVPTVGIDFCHPMLEVGLRKVRAAGLPIGLVEGDALHTPLADNSFDIVTIAFGLRNLESVEAGLREVFRLLKEGGRCAILEFSHPVVPVFRNLFKIYFTQILPRIGNAISGSAFAYRYLPDSVTAFPDQGKLSELMQAVGFSNVTYYNHLGGVAAVHFGDKVALAHKQDDQLPHGGSLPRGSG